ncbi:hypothetical protein MVEN_00666500 [Mycena venus]|uniref:DUF6533 domain-containing protein n=1 Tax=Mycena venus TaxID=2733690 RepID=A0A8H6YSJ1_9AGAR|nr:hypothetical protein MVEN_00666500 [Mycena venus]
MASFPLDAATTLQGLRVYRSLFLAGIVVLVYDHLLTFSAEVLYIWTPVRKKRSSVLYLVVRYSALCGYMAMLSLVFGNFTPKKLSLANEILMLSEEVVVGCMLALRVFALYSFDKRVIATVIAAAIASIAVAVWSIVSGAQDTNTTYDTSVFGCQLSQGPIATFCVGLGGIVGPAWDILLVGFTLYHGSKYRKSLGMSHAGTLWLVLVRDGAIYFGLSSIANLANILMYYFGDLNTAGSVSHFTIALSVTMACRLMINLHAAATAPELELETSELGTLRFS